MYGISTDLPIYPSIHLSIYRSIYLSIYPSIHLSIYLSIHRSIYLSIYLFTYLYPPTVSLYLSFSIYFVKCVERDATNTHGALPTKLCKLKPIVSFLPLQLATSKQWGTYSSSRHDGHHGVHSDGQKLDISSIFVVDISSIKCLLKLPTVILMLSPLYTP